MGKDQPAQFTIGLHEALIQTGARAIALEFVLSNLMQVLFRQDRAGLEAFRDWCVTYADGYHERNQGKDLPEGVDRVHAINLATIEQIFRTALQEAPGSRPPKPDAP